MTKCAVCRQSPEEELWIWQPFGPDEDARLGAFAYPGYHARGFPALHCCNACKIRIYAGETVKFIYRKVWYRLVEQTIEEVKK